MYIELHHFFTLFYWCYSSDWKMPSLPLCVQVETDYIWTGRFTLWWTKDGLSLKTGNLTISTLLHILYVNGKMYQLVPTLSHLCPPKFEPSCPYIEKVSALAACTEWRLFHLRNRNFYNFNCCWWKLWGGETESIYFPIMPLRLLLMALDKKIEEFQQ